jgi:hypothetical protein
MGASRPAEDDGSRHLAEDRVLGREITNVLAVGRRSSAGTVSCAPVWQGARAADRRCVPGGAGLHGRGRPRRQRAAQVELWKGTPLYAVSTWT